MWDKSSKRSFWCKKANKKWDDNFDKIVISKLVEKKNISKYLTGYLDVTRPLVLIFSKMSGYVKIFKDKGWDKNKNNKLCLWV